jgi:hypothetical protein
MHGKLRIFKKNTFKYRSKYIEIIYLFSRPFASLSKYIIQKLDPTLTIPKSYFIVKSLFPFPNEFARFGKTDSMILLVRFP